MKRALAAVPFAIVLSSMAPACGGDDGTAAPSSSGVFGGTPGPDTTKGVECTHPGAGASIGDDRCDCSTTRNVAGEWSGKRTCREGTTCPIRDEDDSFRITQDGIDVRGEIGPAGSPTYVFTGKICGDFIVWDGGPSSGEVKECGQIRFTDDTHYVKDSCYVSSGECRTSFGQGCPSQKGQCTATGAKKPEGAPAIVKDVCN